MLSEDLGWAHAEASVPMRSLWQESGGLQSLDAFAEKSLLVNPSLVPEKIIKGAQTDGVKTLVVSGLRALGEVKVFAEASGDIQLVIVRADFSVRLQRCAVRNRSGHAKDAREMLELDRIHERMGLDAVVALPWALSLVNNGTVDEFRSGLRSLLRL
jgi:dephospho-CoA kinase